MNRDKDRRDFDFASEIHAAAHQGPRFLAHALLFTITGLFVVLLGWAGVAKVDEVTRGQGRVIPSSQIQTMQSLEGGIVKEILVHEGDLVRRDQVLLRIDDTGFSSSRDELQAQRRALLGQIARLEAEIEQKETIEFPPGFLEESPQIAANELALFGTRRDSLESQLTVLRQQAEQREQELNELKAKERQYASSLSLAQQELNLNLSAPPGVVPAVEILRLRGDVTDMQGELETTRSSIPRAESAIREAYERVEDEFLRFRSETMAELNQRRAELSVVEAGLRGATDRVARTDLRSPVDGIVNTLHVTTLGGVIQPGAPLVEIVPIEDSLLVEARVRPSDVAFISPGLAATVKLTAYDYSIYGGLHGHVERISADTIFDEVSGEHFYQIVIRTDQTHLGTEAAPLPIIPGMVASVDILTGEKTVLSYLLKPLNRARDEALRER